MSDTSRDSTWVPNSSFRERVFEVLAEDETLATAVELSDHEADTTNIHGIIDTSQLATTPELAGKADVEDLTAEEAAREAHEADSTAVHGIADTSKLLREGGAAGGALTGTWPSPTLVNEIVETGKIKNLAVTTGKLAAGAVTAEKVAADVATQTEIDDISNNWRLVGPGFRCIIKTDAASDYYRMGEASPSNVVYNAAISDATTMPKIIRLVNADQAVSGKATKYKIRAIIGTNATKPELKFTTQLADITIAGAADAISLDAPGGSKGSAAEVTSPAASTFTVYESGEFELADGTYQMRTLTSAALTNNSMVIINAELLVHNV